jgi:hypothetical protein
LTNPKFFGIIFIEVLKEAINMAKISFTKLGLSKKTDEVKIITYNDQEIEIKQYLPVEDKATLIDAIIANSISDNGFFNPFKLRIITNFEIIKAYTNVSFTEKQSTDNFFKTYDALAFDFIDVVFENIPEDELEEIFESVEEVTKAIVQYNNSLMGILAQVSQNYENVNFDLDKMADVLGNPENLTMVKKMIENV